MATLPFLTAVCCGVLMAVNAGLVGIDTDRGNPDGGPTSTLKYDFFTLGLGEGHGTDAQHNSFEEEELTDSVTEDDDMIESAEVIVDGNVPEATVYSDDAETTAGFFEGDMNVPQFRDGKVYTINTWTNSTLYYTFDSSIGSAERQKIKAAMKHVEDSTMSGSKKCIRIVPKGPQDKRYIIISKGNGCHATLGMLSSGQQAKMSLGEYCYNRGTMAHEILHALGVKHEQSKSYRDDFVSILWDNIQDKYRNNFEKYTFKGLKEEKEYSYGSVMHYGPFAFAKNAKSPTIALKKSVGPDTVIGQREQLSESDVKTLQHRYKCNEDTSNVEKPEPKNYYHNCQFEEKCDVSLKKSNDISWSRTKGALKNGPEGDHTRGTGYYLAAKSNGKKKRTVEIQSKSLKKGVVCLKSAFFNSDKSNTLYIQRIEGLYVSTWTLTSRADQWLNLKLLIPVKDNASIKVRAVFEKSSKKTVIGVDDFSIHRGDC